MKLATFIVSIVLVACGLLLYSIVTSGKVQNLETETYKILLQFISIAIFAQIIALLIANHSRKREEAIAKDGLQREIIACLNKNFTECKKLRRTLRAKSEKNRDDSLPKIVKCSIYDEACSTINDIQLSLEVICKDIEASQALFINYKKLYGNVLAMEEYLNGIVDEFEAPAPKTERNPPVFHYTDLPRIFDLVGPYKTSSFRNSFVHTYYKALDELKSGLLYIGKNQSFKRPSK